MIITYNAVVSRIQNSLNTLNKDMFIPRRFILAVFKSKVEFLMAQKFHDKSLFRETSLFRWIECVKMERIDSVKCGKIELQKCDDIMQSKCVLPKMLWTRYGPTVGMVTNIDGSKKYELISHSYYQSIRNKRNFDKFKGNFAIVYPDNKLVIPDSNVSVVNILIYTLDEKADDISECEDNPTNCQSYWEREFEISDKVSEIAIQETMKEMMMRIQIPVDELPDGDSNQKTQHRQ